MKKVIKNLRLLYEGGVQHRGESSTKESKVIAGQSYSIKELMSRQMAGNMPELSRVGEYSDEEDFTVAPDFDITDAKIMLDGIESKRQMTVNEKYRSLREQKLKDEADLKRLREAEKNMGDSPESGGGSEGAK